MHVIVVDGLCFHVHARCGVAGSLDDLNGGSGRGAAFYPVCAVTSSGVKHLQHGNM